MATALCRSGIFLILASMVFASACDSTGEEGLGNLSGVVHDSTTGDPVSGASVRILSRQMTTGADGRFAFQGLASGTATLDVGATGFGSYSQQVTLAEGENQHDVDLIRNAYFELESAEIGYTLHVPPSLASVRGVLVVLPGSGGESRSFARFEFGAGVPQFIVEHRDALADLAERFGLAVLGVDPRNVQTVNVVGDALVMLDEFAETARHAELAEAPLLLWGYSLGGCYALDIPFSREGRIIGFIRQKAACFDGDVDRGDLKTVPGYHVIGDLDTEERRLDITAGFEANRQAGAIWALITDPDVGHNAMEERPAGRELIITWMEEVLEQRMPPPSGPVLPLQAIDESSGWLGDRESLEIGSFECFSGDKSMASWLPSMETALQWQAHSSSGSVTAISSCG